MLIIITLLAQSMILREYLPIGLTEYCRLQSTEHEILTKDECRYFIHMFDSSV